jgi:DMSO/TMAO reductase YedYZ molybdopterin-dependent catalytic subunit
MRFGLLPFAERFPRDPAVAIQLRGELRNTVTVAGELRRLSRVEQRSDFHCVTTWSCRALVWGGYRFADFYRDIVMPLAGPSPDARFVVLRAQDGARTSLPLEDLMADDVLLADRLNGEPLPIAHGAPLRLVAPSHYGYKSLKHVDRIDFLTSDAAYRPVGFRFMQHPRARVALEERGQWVPGWLLRLLYRPLIGLTARRFERALAAHGGAAPPRER